MQEKRQAKITAKKLYTKIFFNIIVLSKQRRKRIYKI